MTDHFLGKDAKPAEYDINMRQNNVYDGIRCAFDYLHYSMGHIVVDLLLMIYYDFRVF